MDLTESGEIDQLLKELADARAWPDRFKETLTRGLDIRDEVKEADNRVNSLEKRAQEAMKKLGCVSPATRLVYQGMADMLISWKTFKDSVE